MKYNKIIPAVMLAAIVGVSSTSCSDDFLEEELTTTYNTDYFKTQEGIDALVIGAYQKLKFKFNYIWAIECHGMGIDEFTDANNVMPAWNHYSSALNSAETGANQPMWDNYYGLVEPANIIIANVQQYYDKGSDSYNTRLGEGYFFRAYAYFELVKQFGPVPVKTTPSTTVETYFTRPETEEPVYTQIIADFEQAYNLLPEEGEAFGRVTKYAVAHFLAKAHLFRASEIYDSWNSATKSADLDAVIKYATEVVDHHPLCNDFVELWDYQEPNGANEKVSEVVLSAQFSDDQSTWGRYGNQMHLYYPSVYQNMPGTKRDISGGREFSYVSATEYTMSVFDRVNDSRFWKSFITCYGCNDSNGAQKWTAADSTFVAENGLNFAKTDDSGYRYKGGEVAIKYIVNNPGDTRYKAETTIVIDDKGKEKTTYVLATVAKDDTLCRELTFVRYLNGEQQSWSTGTADQPYVGNYYSITPHLRSVALSKFRDGYRVNIASQFGTRDAIIARSADDVLMIAEAYIRKGEFDNAVVQFNRLRDRAGYAEGEDRSVNVDGGQAYKNNSACSGKGGGYSAEGAIYSEQNTYFESNNIEVTTAETKTAMHLDGVDDIYNSPSDQLIYDALGCSSNEDKMMCFLLNERTRELVGELHRWEDLMRTKQLDIRWHTFNDGVSRGLGDFDPDKHYRRPIPQSFLDGITNSSGGTLSDEEKSAMQNPGY